MQSLDGLRAIAVLLVLLGHIGIGQVELFGVEQVISPIRFLKSHNYALLGVDIFFVLSGFLITHILLSEKIARGTIRLKNFYFRRFIRIFPVYYLYLFFLIFISIFYPVDITPQYFLQSFLYLNNFYFGAGHQLIHHAWSLSVEEQYYLLWPWVVVSVQKFQIIVIICFCSSLLCIFYRIFFYLNPFSATYNYLLAGLILHGNAILVGSFFGYMATNYPLHRIFNSSFRSPLLVLCAFAIIVTLEYLVRNGIIGFITVPFKGIMQHFAIGTLIIYSVCCSSWFSRLLNNIVLVRIGLWSYSIYIWQQFWLLPGKELYQSLSVNLQWMFVFPFPILMVFVVGWLSYRLVEMPLNTLKNKYSIS